MAGTHSLRRWRNAAARAEIVITNDLYLRRPGILDPVDQSLLEHGKLVMTLLEAIEHMRANGYSAEAEELRAQIPADPDPSQQIYMQVPGTHPLDQQMIDDANATMRALEQQAFALVNPRRAHYIRELRCLKCYSWRALAHECYRSWRGADWDPPSNQLMGIALCERAAVLLGENHRTMPWNDV